MHKEELPRMMSAIPAWDLVDNNKQLSRKFTARNFQSGAHSQPKRACEQKWQAHQVTPYGASI